MTRFPRTLLLALLFAIFAPAHAVGLNDTGIDTCYNDTVADSVAASDPASIARDAGTHPRQDCRYGRDAAAAAGVLPKTGAGAKGFDFTKIANNGSTLAASAVLGAGATAWACTRDNVTGLTWEVKTTGAADLRYSGHTYAWYSTDATTNGGIAGDPGSNTCNATLPSSLCNTQAFVTAVNTAALCTYADWRLPTRRELHTLVHAGVSNPSIDPAYFPTPQASDFWSGSSYVPDPADAWIVVFGYGVTVADVKTNANYARLGRGGQF